MQRGKELNRSNCVACILVCFCFMFHGTEIAALKTVGPVTQGNFLRNTGILSRLQTLLRTAPDETTVGRMHLSLLSVSPLTRCPYDLLVYNVAQNSYDECQPISVAKRYGWALQGVGATGPGGRWSVYGWFSSRLGNTNIRILVHNWVVAVNEYASGQNVRLYYE